MLRAIATLCCALFGAATAVAEALPRPVAQALARAGVPESSVALYVHEVDAPKPAATFHADRAMNPASAIKLVTTFAALDLLGPAYSWRTEAYLHGSMAGDVLDGDLVLKGYGDPQLTIERFWLFLRALRARGLREIKGDLVLDRSFFDEREHDPTRFDNEPLRPYNVGPDALLLNYKAVQFYFLPHETTKGVRIVPEPKLAHLEVRSEVRLADGPCGDWRAALRFDLQPEGARTSARFAGAMPASCGERVWSLAPFPHAQYVYGVFKTLWQELGGTIGGTVRDGVAPAGKPFAQHVSPSAAEVLRDMNKYSNNVMARNVYLTLGAEALQAPARYERSAQAVQAWLEARKLALPELVLENGSGLSRNDRISAHGLGRLLLAAYHSPIMPEFVSTMPLVAYDGTMKRRSGLAHVKTGYLVDVRSLAGFVLDRNGHRFAVVFIVNHAHAGATQGAQDAVLRWVHEAASQAPRTRPSGRPQ